MAWRVICPLIGILSQAIWLPAAEDSRELLERAQNSEKSGELEAAFVAYLGVPGAEHAAARIARPRPDHFLAVLRRHASTLRPTSVHLLTGELLLASGKREPALEAFRSAAEILGDRASHGEGYLVWPPTQHRQAATTLLASPFSLGCGSHSDNWLIRRFVALDAAGDAAKELQRIWQIHRAQHAALLDRLEDVHSRRRIENGETARAPAWV